ncbi:DUF397 domain-containing protein [Streptomyces millisiae]|uniref:DUF397 domain-containing protein n=1 Tax=Streptomyces millisiae TaxID=3075542 RepID=A0ABU2LQ21_9ACTN|nr:DUF397 domain-containing protein [Streptomyces sp. DSM 44918]MDT0319682.1 DUF397 domain-containing protein [Streptomyces sp. DSM 44918]
MSDALRWLKSSYSDDSGGACVEIAHDWHRSSHSDSSGGACVEVAAGPIVHVRDSKQPAAPHLDVPRGAWSAFIATVR